MRGRELKLRECTKVPGHHKNHHRNHHKKRGLVSSQKRPTKGDL